MFFNDTATTEIYTLSLHDALPISNLDYDAVPELMPVYQRQATTLPPDLVKSVTLPRFTQVNNGFTDQIEADRKSTRLNSSHANISYAVFCLKKKRQY